MFKSLFSKILIIAGLACCFYPAASALFYEHQQKEILTTWEQSLLIIGDGDSNQQTGDLVHEAANTGIAKSEQEKRLTTKNAEGILSIGKINLYLPILQGATEKNLNISVASIEHTGKAGQAGNYVISGHRSHGYGKLFNRLEELQPGDLIKIDQGEKSYSYAVTEKLLVQPDEIWVLEGNKGKKEISLITCHPMINPTLRLVIKGELQEGGQ